MDILTAFTIHWAPAIVLGLFLGASAGVYWALVLRWPRPRGFWLAVDALWVAASVVAFFILALSAALSPPAQATAELKREMWTQFEAVTVARRGFHFTYCSAHAGDQILEWEAARSPEERALCDRFVANSLRHGQVNDALVALALDHDMIPYTAQSHASLDSASAIARDWNRIELATMDFDQRVEAYNRVRQAAQLMVWVEGLRTFWFYIFPIIAGLRINRAFAEARADRAKRSGPSQAREDASTVLAETSEPAP